MPKAASRTNRDLQAVNQVRIIVMFFLVSGMIFTLASVIISIVNTQLNSSVLHALAGTSAIVPTAGQPLADALNLGIWSILAGATRDVGVASLLFGVGLALVDVLKVQMMKNR